MKVLVQTLPSNQLFNKSIMKKIYLFLTVFSFFLGIQTFAQVNTYSVAGTYSWVCPPGVTSVIVEAWGGGGAGGGTGTTTGTLRIGGGGGGGAYGRSTLTVIPGTTYTIVVGAGGTGVSAAAGNPGGTSSFNSTLVTALGGDPGGATNNATAGTAGAGGGTGVATTIFTGGNGSVGTATASGSGGGGAGNAANGGNATGGTAGTGGTVGGGAGSAGRTANGAGAAGTAPGGGGSGGYAATASATARAGGAGGAGKVILTYTCGTYTLPLIEGFNTAANTLNPDCWSQQNVSGALAIQYVTTTAGTSPTVSTPFEGTRMVFYNSYSNSTSTRLVSPVINATGVSSIDVGFQWYYFSTGGVGSYLTEGVTVQWSTDGTTWNDFSGNFIRRYGPTNGWAPVLMTLPAGAGNQPVLYIGFKMTGNGGYDIYMDAANISASPSCLVPTAVSTTTTSSTSANVNFTSAGTSFIVEYGATGFTPGTGATAGVGGTVVTGSSSPISLSSLTANSNYDVYVRQDCTGSANGYSANTAKVTLFTGYCTSSNTGTATYINNFSTAGATTNISKLATGYTTGGYANYYATDAVTAEATSSFTASFTIAGGSAGVAIWIDYNNNLIFETSERVYNSAGYLATGSYTTPAITVANVTPGDYRMRIKTDFNNTD